ncbi:hypothetical protein RFI_20092, partial [Reticulomyxa filosa]
DRAIDQIQDEIDKLLNITKCYTLLSVLGNFVYHNTNDTNGQMTQRSNLFQTGSFVRHYLRFVDHHNSSIRHLWPDFQSAENDEGRLERAQKIMHAFLFTQPRNSMMLTIHFWEHPLLYVRELINSFYVKNNEHYKPSKKSEQDAAMKDESEEHSGFYPLPHKPQVQSSIPPNFVILAYHVMHFFICRKAVLFAQSSST